MDALTSILFVDPKHLKVSILGWDIEDALDDDLITIVHRDDDLGVYEFRVGELQAIVTVQVSRLPTSERAIYYRSHAIHTPIQATPYHQSRSTWDDVPYALHQAISSITDYYSDATRAGHAPEEAWLVRQV
ncbi:hypothetical protein T8A63_07385 [Sulfitobacter sp. OXR-159]|uniref:hypothetical protein n=1 Tax=Sulfitobacter sp. OXR-159 TaxID=3100174 RepID=UPI002AC9DB08|nr:hypothetical protein [Sulfitobacter sp. OXR-159]WPZ30778.1 hypothetical protein T8A63_06875 [Sulfitobacter sp. OXR-159]WPZ30879.1 hypothetical protein T8A63_07385 [Sulfitobacter sp. OXR-159]